MPNAQTIRLRRRILVETYALFLNYPVGVVALLGKAEPRKALRSVQRIATRIWERAEPYHERGVKLNELSEKILKPFAGAEEKHQEFCAAQIALRPTDETWKFEQEVLRDAEIAKISEEKDEALWKGGYITALWTHQQEDGMAYDEVELSKDLRETFVDCFHAYVQDRFVVEEESTDEKEKKVKKPRFTIPRRSGPFGGMTEVPIGISPAAEAEIEYAIGDYSDEEEKDLALRVEQLWAGDRKQLSRRMKELEEKHGPNGETPPLV